MAGTSVQLMLRSPSVPLEVNVMKPISTIGGERNEAWLVGGDMLIDPVLVLRNSGIHTRKVGFSTTLAKAHNSRLDPERTLFADHRTTRVTL